MDLSEQFQKLRYIRAHFYRPHMEVRFARNSGTVAARNFRMKLPNARDLSEGVPSFGRFSAIRCTLRLITLLSPSIMQRRWGVNSSVIIGNYLRQLSSISIHMISIGAEPSGIKAGSRMPAAPVKRPASWAFTLKTRQILACSLARSLTSVRDLSNVSEISPRTRYYLFGLARSGSHEYRVHCIRRRRIDDARKTRIGRERTGYR